MNEAIISDEGINHVLQRMESHAWSAKDEEERDQLRQSFQNTYTKERINNFKKEDYYAGLGRKQGCLAYDLEWGTTILGSIKGGSKYKYGYEADFPRIKTLLQKVVSIEPTSVYTTEGLPSSEMQVIIKLSKEISGFKTGRTVIPKLLSIYYPNLFLPLFNDQDHFLSKLLVSGLDTEKAGLELYLEYNFKLQQVKRKIEEITGRRLGNFEFFKLLYHAFPKDQGEKVDADSVIDEAIAVSEKFEALEVQHYQTLLHRNMPRLFPNVKYFDVEEQMRKNGQYDTQTVGIMDMLCIDEQGDFLVIEIKRSATDKTIGQILRYMGWTKEELCKDGQKVKGLIVAERKDIQLEFAMKMIPDVKFLKLGLTITLE